MSETIQEPGVRVAAASPEVEVPGKHGMGLVGKQGAGVVGGGDFAEGSVAVAGDGEGLAWEEFVAKFDRHAAAWEGAMFLFLSEMFQDEDYQAIIEMGPAVVPLILRRLEAKPHWWMPALIRLTGVDPSERRHLGDLMEERRVWLEWGKQQGYLTGKDGGEG